MTLLRAYQFRPHVHKHLWRPARCWRSPSSPPPPFAPRASAMAAVTAAAAAAWMCQRRRRGRLGGGGGGWAEGMYWRAAVLDPACSVLAAAGQAATCL